MSAPSPAKTWSIGNIKRLRVGYIGISLFCGALTALGFAPFHLPGTAILCIAILYTQLQRCTLKQAFFCGLTYGIGFMGIGVSWVHISIQTYGHLNVFLSLALTSIFVLYLALFPALCALSYRALAQSHRPLLNALLFAGLWCISEYLRANCFTGFPWLLLGFGQIDTPLKYLLPIIGIYGLGFLAVFSAALLSNITHRTRFQLGWLITFVFILIAPTTLQHITWGTTSSAPISIAVIQANLSMRDKWSDTLFWEIFEHYQHHIETLIGKTQLIITPESAISLPANYIQELLDNIHIHAKNAKSAVLIGIPEATDAKQTEFYNTIDTLGQASGAYRKQHLVPFGEYIPHWVAALMSWLELPLSNMKAGSHHQGLIEVQRKPMASMICYELAYPQLLRQQLPAAQWIVSLSDDGWFEQSFAIHQHLQMAQALALLTNRYHIMANNDGLSSIINNRGEIVQSLPPYTSGILEGNIYPIQGTTPWVAWGDRPVFAFSVIILFIFMVQKCSSLAVRNKRRYPKKLTRI